MLRFPPLSSLLAPMLSVPLLLLLLLLAERLPSVPCDVCPAAPVLLLSQLLLLLLSLPRGSPRLTMSRAAMARLSAAMAAGKHQAGRPTACIQPAHLSDNSVCTMHRVCPTAQHYLRRTAKYAHGSCLHTHMQHQA